MDGYRTIPKEGTAEFTEQRSRFIGCCRPVTGEEEALRFIAARKKQYWDASHNVYAYALREGGIRRFSDDGEPQGTAGLPVLDILKDTLDCCVVVTRYFGGILLGTGGLVRAYSKGARLALEAAGTVWMRECSCCRLRCGYAFYGRTGALLAAAGAVLDDTVFEEEVTLLFHLPADGLEALQQTVTEESAGTLFVEEVEKRLMPLQ